MTKENLFLNKSGRAAKYIIYLEDNLITIKYYYCPPEWNFPEDEAWILPMNVQNIPSLVKIINYVFSTSHGYFCNKEIHEHGDDIRVAMDSERGIHNLMVRGTRKDGPEIGQGIAFEFNRGEIPRDPKDRKPTPAMTWVMDTLQEFYDQWKQEQESASTAPSGSDGQTGVSIM